MFLYLLQALGIYSTSRPYEYVHNKQDMCLRGIKAVYLSSVRLQFSF